MTVAHERFFADENFAAAAPAAQNTCGSPAAADGRGTANGPAAPGAQSAPLPRWRTVAPQPPADVQYVKSSAGPRASTESWLWLANALGPAAQTMELFELFPNPEELFRTRGDLDLSAYFTPAQAEALRETRPEAFSAVRRACEAQRVGILCYDDPAYPPLLRQIPTAPPVLFYRGDLAYASAPLTFAFVGTRRPSAYGVEAARALAVPLAKAGAVLVSGLAAGLDSEGHKAALAAGTPTIACIAFGHDKCYPAVHATLKGVIERQGLVLSEYPPGTGPQKPFFLQRNRLIAGLSRGICVAEARTDSGTMNTVGAALEFGRDVFSVPGSIFSPLCEGTNHLLEEGAVPAVSAGSILHYYGIDESDVAALARMGEPDRQAAQEPAQPLSPGARVLRTALTAQPQSVAQLVAKTSLAPHTVLAGLTELELAGIACQQAGRQFLLK